MLLCICGLLFCLLYQELCCFWYSCHVFIPPFCESIVVVHCCLSIYGALLLMSVYMLKFYVTIYSCMLKLVCDESCRMTGWAGQLTFQICSSSIRTASSVPMVAPSNPSGYLPELCAGIQPTAETRSLHKWKLNHSRWVLCPVQLTNRRKLQAVCLLPNKGACICNSSTQHAD